MGAVSRSGPVSFACSESADLPLAAATALRRKCTIVADMNELRDVPVAELRSNLAAYLNEVRRAGEEFVVTRNGHPMAQLGPIEKRNNSDDGK
jgi:prevent-host-death family protein